jgi:hypothetical protein
MRKIIPAAIVTAAAVAAVVTFIKKKIDKKEKVNLIEVDIKPKPDLKKTLEKVGDVAGNIVSVGKEILIETVDTVGDVVETFIENPTNLSGIVDEVKEGIEEIQEIIADGKKEDDEEQEPEDEKEESAEETGIDKDMTAEEPETEEAEEHEVIEEPEIKEEIFVEETEEEEIVEPIEELFEKNEVSEINYTEPEDDVDCFKENTAGEDTVEKALLISSIVADIAEEEEKFINEAISQEIEKLIDEVVEVDQVQEPALEEAVEEAAAEEPDEELSIDEIMEEVALQAQEHIEEVLSATMDEEIPLDPIDLAQSDDDIILKIVDENVGEINLINDIIESLEEDNSNEESIEDLEDIVETAIYEEPAVIDDALLTEEQFLEKCVGLYTGVKENKIRLIIKQIGVMLETVEAAETLNLQHFATFASGEDKERYASIAAIEGHQVAHSDNERELIILNTLDTDKISLSRSILQLAQDLTEYNGSYRGWTVVS